MTSRIMSGRTGSSFLFESVAKRIFLMKYQLVTHIQRWLWSFVLWRSPPSPRHSGTWCHGHSASGLVASSVGSCCRNHPHWSGYRQWPWPTSDDLAAVPQSRWCTCSWQRCWLAPFHRDCRWWWWGRMAGLEQNTRNKICRTKFNHNIYKKYKLKTMSVWPAAVHSTILLCHFHAKVASLFLLIQLCWTHLRHTVPVHPS